ncbi:unnamed protein product [Darwinula stevensoni]|uniref:Uncharacterized protein n=1 Tax=Darwinula stevensoni TaxID=69355 RepID=A0A7R8X7C1_9CRUS|nr:unnamed protein product [Darwinula stevensoni]CAG0888994.1 unnamed protein product [Darwinula stevensoni]
MSHSFHEVTMTYPMRGIRKSNLKLIHNLIPRIPFPIDQDFYVSPTFQDMLNRTGDGKPLNWRKSLQKYYYREEWEVFAIKNHSEIEIPPPWRDAVRKDLERDLLAWQRDTGDPWLCFPNGVLIGQKCLPLLNDLRDP